MKIAFVGKHNYQEYLLDCGSSNLFLYMFETYKRILNAIILLQTKNIVHFDLKDNNIMFNDQMKIPILIDFGLSIHIDKINDYLENYFYTFSPEYYYWSLEVHYINYLINHTDEISMEDIAYIFVKENKILQDNFSKDFLKKYEKQCIKILKEYQKMNKKEAIYTIIKTSWATWDNYSLSILFLKYLTFFNNRGFIKNNFTINFVEILLQNIHPFPQKRLTTQETLDNFTNIFYDSKINNAKNFQELLENLIETKQQMKVNIKEDKKEIKRLQKMIG